MSEKNEDKGFNDAELQDIMDEIENLEKEFVDEDTAVSEQDGTSEHATVSEQPKSETKEEHTPVEASAETEKEPAPEPESSVSDETDDVLGQIENEVESEDSNVVEMKTVTSPVETPFATSTDTPVSFTGSGQIDFQMSVNLGGKIATVKVDPELGLVVNLEGVDLQITEDGCSVEMDGGVKFSVPFGTTAAAKKAA
tara:strand:+ start:30732 stop:31322 length:591 start_codon:yes stop_codon:yes gene_type:complete